MLLEVGQGVPGMPKVLPWDPVAMASLSYATSKLSSLEPSLQVTTFLSWSIASASAEKYLFCRMHDIFAYLNLDLPHIMLRYTHSDAWDEFMTGFLYSRIF